MMIIKTMIIISNSNNNNSNYNNDDNNNNNNNDNKDNWINRERSPYNFIAKYYIITENWNKNA